ASHRALVLEWLRADPDLSLDAVAERLARISPQVTPSEADAIHQAKQYIKQLYRSLSDQGLLEGAEFAALVRFARDASNASFDLPRELRPKNAYNLLRLIVTAARWLREGAPVFVMEGDFRERLLAIKQGTVPIEEVVAEAESMAPELERARDASCLPA